MNISVIIPNFNGGKILEKNLPLALSSFKNFDKGFLEIIISDDSSTDSSIEIIKKFIDGNKKSRIEIKLLTSDKGRNMGFSSNVDKGVAKARGDILILLNTDVIPTEDFWKPLLPHFDDPKVFAVGCMDESIEERKVVLRGRGVGKWSRGFLIHSAGNLNRSDTLWVSGGSGAFRKSIWDELGGLDPIYNPFYWEDIDLSYRARKSGYLTLFEKKSIVRHEHDRGAVKESFNKKDVLRVVYRNQFLFVWKNANPSMLVKHFLWLPYQMISSLAGNRFLIIGFFSALAKLPDLIRSRRGVSKSFMLSDREVVDSVEI